MQHFSQIAPRVCTSVLFISKVFLKKRTLKQFDSYDMAVMEPFCISRIQINNAIVSTMCIKAKKEALARRILRVRQFPPGTCLIDNATILNAMCDALLP